VNQIGLGSSSRKLARFYQITGERNVAPSLAPEIVPVCLVDNLSEVDTSPDSEFRDFYSFLELSCVVNEEIFFGINVTGGVAPEQILVRLRRVIVANNGLGNAQVFIGMGAANFQAQTGYLQRVKRGEFNAPTEVLLSNRVCQNVGVAAGSAGTNVAGFSIPVGNTFTFEPDLYVGPSRGVFLNTQGLASQLSMTLVFQELPLSRVGGQ
jgi:hypothetical protein